jgi:micrococcal nuclease
MKPNYIYNVNKILKVVDGDTVDALIDLGFYTYIHKRVRLYGLNAPESRTRDKEEKARGIAAKRRLKELLKSKNIKIISHGVGKFDRVLGEFICDDENINEQLVTEGHAVKYFGGKRG